MALHDMKNPQSILQAVEEFDRLGREGFLRKYGFGPAREYVLVNEGKQYDSKDIMGAAHGYEYPAKGPLRANQFSGGKLTALGFDVAKVETPPSLPTLLPGELYSWAELARRLGFNEDYLGAAGGMVPVAGAGLLLLITHPGGGKAFDYEDYWAEETLIYTGRGQKGDQKLAGANQDIAENRKPMFGFEGAGPRQLRFLGHAHCQRYFWALGPDRGGNERKILRFVLRFEPSAGRVFSGKGPRLAHARSVPPHRRSRPFDPGRIPTPPSPGLSSTTPEERAQMLEKANRGHHGLLSVLAAWLARAGWTDIEEVPGAVDLWAKSPQGRVIFEAKTVSTGNEASQARHALSQLFEYRFFYGSEDDSLCLVIDVPLSDRRLRFLEAVGIAVARVDGATVLPLGTLAASRLRNLSTRMRHEGREFSEAGSAHS